jgi:putative glycosyltransferase (TIGR04372 family)
MELSRRVYCIEAMIARGRLGRFSAFLLGRSLYVFACEWGNVIKFAFPSLSLVAIGNAVPQLAIQVFLEKGQACITLAHAEFYSSVSNIRADVWCPNFALLDLWRRKLVISSFLSIPHYIAWFCRPEMVRRSVDYFLLSRLPEVLDLSGVTPKWNEEDVKKADVEFAKMKIHPQSPYVCFLARDKKYYEGFRTMSGVPYNEFSSYRDTPISLYHEAMSWLARKGYLVFRMGAAVEGGIGIEAENIIDYAKDYRTEFMDIYLSATCRFFVSCGTGIDMIPIIEGIPLAFVNHPTLSLTPEKVDYENMFFLPMRFYADEGKKLLSLKEAYLLGVVGEFAVGKNSPKKMGILCGQNTQREILQIVQEIDARLDGVWVETEQDRELQERYRSIIRENENLPTDYRIKFRISAHFLRENAEWFLK